VFCQLQFTFYQQIANLEKLCVCTKFSSKVGETATESYKKLKLIFGEETMNRTQTSGWFFQVNSAVTLVKDAEHSGYLTMSKTDESVAQIKGILHENSYSVRSHLDHATAF
jgi:hypothetical protein